MKAGASGSFATQLKTLREAAGFTQAELATIAGLSVHAVSALERGERRRPHVDTVRALSAALDLAGAAHDAFAESARAPANVTAVDELAAGSLPLPLTTLVGREADLQTLQLWLADPTIRLITLTGPGGAGKTRLALELARGIAADGKSHVVFASLAAARNPEFVASTIAEALGLSDVTAADLPRRVRSACHDRITLLLLDNFEHVLDAAPLAAALLSTVAPLRLLATSRAPLRVRGEREYAVGPLALNVAGESKSHADVARAPAVRLFIERVRDANPDFRLTPANTSTVKAICERLDALPLALELAARWMKVLSADGLLQRLEHDVLLSMAARDFPERQQTMNATVAWSYGLLRADEQRAFRRLAVLPDRFPVEAAHAVLAGRDSVPDTIDETLRTVAGLMDKSLLLRTEASVAVRPSYRMLETVRAYAGLELTAAGERQDAIEGLVRYAIAEADMAEVELRGLAQIEWLDRVRDDLENYRTALAWLIERGRAAEACTIAWGLKYFWLIRGHATEGLQWYEQILEMPSLAAAVELRALAGAAVLWYTQGELESARRAAHRALSLTHTAADADVIAQVEHLFGHVEHAFGNVNAARDRFVRSIEGFRALGAAAGTGSVLSAMAVLSLAIGEVDDAERLLDEAVSVLPQAGPWFLTWALYARAILALRRGDATTAITVMRQSLTRIRELHDKFAFVYALVPLAAAAVLKGDDAWAARILGVRDAVTEGTGVTVVDKSVQDLRDEVEREACARLGPDRWARAYAAGRTSSIETLLKHFERLERKG